MRKTNESVFCLSSLFDYSAVILSARGPMRSLHRGPQRQIFVVGVEVGGGKQRICFSPRCFIWASRLIRSEDGAITHGNRNRTSRFRVLPEGGTFRPASPHIAEEFPSPSPHRRTVRHAHFHECFFASRRKWTSPQDRCLHPAYGRVRNRPPQRLAVSPYPGPHVTREFRSVQPQRCIRHRHPVSRLSRPQSR